MTIAIITLIATLAAAVFGMFAWLTAREHQPFALRRVEDRVVLTRTRRPAVQIRQAFVYHHGKLVTDDNAATAEWRILGRDDDLVLSLRRVHDDGTDSYVDPAETLDVQYRLLWPWALESPSRRRLPRRGDGMAQLIAIDRRRDEIGEDTLVPDRPWKVWSRVML